MYHSLLTGLTLISLSTPAFATVTTLEQESHLSERYQEQQQLNEVENTQIQESVSDRTIQAVHGSRSIAPHPEIIVAICSTTYGCGDNHNETMLRA